VRRAVSVIGDALLDVHVTPTVPIQPGGDVPADVRLEPGGQGANLAVRLARRAIDVRLLCATGDDRSGALVRDALTAEGVRLVDVGAHETGAVVVLLDADRDRTMLSRRVALFPGSTADRRWPALLDADWLIVSGYAVLEPAFDVTATGPTPRRVVVGCSLDAGQAPAWERAVASLDPHLVVVSLEEARTIARSEGDPAGLARALGLRMQAVIVVTHPAGAAAASADDVVEVSAVSSRPVVDTTGAGDAFAAALVAELLDGDRWPPTAERLGAAMRAATRLATAVAGVPGAQGRVAGEVG
jgi:ribokinase